MSPDRPPEPPLLIPRAIHDAMVAHCRREAPREACGILGGVPPLVASFHPLQNVDSRPEVRYTADPLDLIATERSLRTSGGEWLAIYHSHPTSPPVPSRVDLAMNFDGPTPRIIVGLLNDPPEVRAWRLASETFAELPWRLLPDPAPPGAVESAPEAD